jgi:chromosome segregation ATPase
LLHSPLSLSLCYFKTEIDILTNEVNGLQRELGHTLESLDTANGQLNEYKESMNNMKRELRRASKKVKELSAEAEARDRLIETFSNILLKKIDGINSSGEEGSGFVGLEGNIEEGMVDNLVLDQGPTRIVESAPTA